MGKPGPKPLSAATLKARGSPLAVARAREEWQRQGLGPRVVPVRYPLPKTLSKQARAWGIALMTEAYFTQSEHKLLCEMLALWDHVQTLKRDVQVHGVSQTDKAGVARGRPEARALEHGLQLLLAYAKKLEVKESP